MSGTGVSGSYQWNYALDLQRHCFFKDLLLSTWSNTLNCSSTIIVLHWHPRVVCSKLNTLTKLLKTLGKSSKYLVNTNSTIMGVVCKDGIILGTEKIVTNKMMVSGTDKRIYSVTKNSGTVFNGIIPDGRSMMQRARDECLQYEKQFGIKMPGAVLAERMSL